jgi:halocyanin-like protein
MSANDERAVGRRTALKTIAAAAAAGTVGTVATGSAAAQTDLSDWLGDVGNFDGVADRTGQDEVTVEVGVQGNGGAFGFGPAAVRVDPGTTVIWEWTGEGTPHNVVAEGGSFESELISEAGATFEQTFESEGVTRYACTPHKPMGMKGAVIVGDVKVTTASGGGATATPAPTASGSSGGDGSSGDGGSGGDFAEPDYEGWFDNVGNFDGTVDRTGQDEVTIQVGADGNNGAFAFEPAAVRVDPGTTVIWEWTGKGGQHNVVSEGDPAFESPLQGTEGDTYALEFDGSGVAKYACAPHEAAGMKGAVVVGDPAAGGGGLVDLETVLWGLVGTIVAAPFAASAAVARSRRKAGRADRDGGQPAD